MLLYYVRHAQSQNNALYLETGSYKGRNEDAPLSTMGKKQLPYVADFMHKELQKIQKDGDGKRRDVPVTLYCSLMERAVQTGSAIADRCGLPLFGYRDLYEVGGIYLKDEKNGEKNGLKGKDKAFFMKNYPLLHFPAGVSQDGWWNRPHEAREERFARAKRVLADIRKKHYHVDEVVILVSHAEFSNHFLKAVLGIPEESPVWFEMMNTAVTLIDFKEKSVHIPFINRHHFLPPELITG